jgi:UDP-3-O-[3-hydroxymyristoyl] glucosamine N-acyltransferase
MSNSGVYKLHEIASMLGAELWGDANHEIDGVASLDQASSSQIGFLVRSDYLGELENSSAGAVIVGKEYADLVKGNALVLSNPYLGYAKATRLFDNKPVSNAGNHATAIIGQSAQVDKTAAIGAHAVVEAGAIIEANVEVGSGCYIGANVVLGANSTICANVSIYHGVTIGKRAIIHSGSVIGADGFGFASDEGRWEKIAQLGSVAIGDDVEIGACTTIDRGALNNTVIENGVKIDNQVMVAHNVRIGAHTAIAGCVGISGSTKIGRHCTIAGGVGFVGHISIVDHTHITCMAMVTKSITEPGSYSSGTGLMPTREWKKSAVRIRQIDDLYKRIKELEQQLVKLKNQGTPE